MAPGLPARMAIVCVVLAIAPAAYADKRQVAAIDLSGDHQALELRKAVYRSLRDHWALTILGDATVDAALEGALLDEDGRHFDDARKNLFSAETELGQFFADAAARAATDGMHTLAFAAPSTVAPLYAQLAFAFGAAQLGLRHPAEAADAFALVHRLVPAFEPDGLRYTPDITDAYRAAAARPPVVAKLDVKGAGEVWIDGFDAGAAPGTFDAAIGLHLVQLAGPERETRGRQVTVVAPPPSAAGPVTTVDDLEDAAADHVLLVQRARLALERAPDPAARAGAMKHLAELLGVGDAVLITRSAANKLLVQTWRDREPGFSALVEVGTQQPIDLLEPLAPPKPPEDPHPRIVKPFVPPPIVIEKPWYTKTWARASLAGSILTAIVVGAALVAQDHMLGVNGNPQWK